MTLFLELLVGIYMMATSWSGKESVKSVPFWVGVILVILAVIGFDLSQLTNLL